MENVEDKESRMHSIQETNEENLDEFDQIGQGMRTGLSMEDDEPEDDFNKRDHTPNKARETEDLDDREDIDEMDVAGTQTRLQYQSHNEIAKKVYRKYSPKKNLNSDLHEIEEEKINKDYLSDTIPVSTQKDITQFSVHGNKITKFNTPAATNFVNHNITSNALNQNIGSEHDATTFSVQNVDHPDIGSRVAASNYKNMDSNENSDNDDEQDLAPQNIENQNSDDNEAYDDSHHSDQEQYDQNYDDEENEEGTFEEYEIDNEEVIILLILNLYRELTSMLHKQMTLKFLMFRIKLNLVLRFN